MGWLTENQIRELYFKILPHLKLKANPVTLKPKQKGTVTGTYDAGIVNDWGFIVDRVQINYNGKEDFLKFS